jgi:hypothetical protein
MLVSVFTATILCQNEQISVKVNTGGCYDGLGMALSRIWRQIKIKYFGGDITCEISD